MLNGIQSLHERLDELQHVVAQRLEAAGMPATSLLHARIEGGHRPQLPAWRRHTEGEARWQVALCTAVAIALQVAVPDRLVLVSPSWALPALEGAMLICLIIANPHRINRQSRALRWFSLMLAALISFANAWSLEQLAAGLISGHQHWDRWVAADHRRLDLADERDRVRPVVLGVRPWRPGRQGAGHAIRTRTSSSRR